MRTPNLKSWYRDFAALGRDVGEEHLEKVLVWYIKHMDEDYMPEAYTARAFRDKFPAIEAKYREDPASVEVSPEAAEVTARVAATHPVPKGILKKLPAIIQRSMDAYKPFWESLYPLAEKMAKDPEAHWDLSLLRHLLGKGFFMSPKFFVQYVWMPAVLQELRRHQMFQTRYMIWGLKRTLFKTIGRQAASEYTENPDRWDSLARHWE